MPSICLQSSAVCVSDDVLSPGTNESMLHDVIWWQKLYTWIFTDAERLWPPSWKFRRLMNDVRMFIVFCVHHHGRKLYRNLAYK